MIGYSLNHADTTNYIFNIWRCRVTMARRKQISFSKCLYRDVIKLHVEGQNTISAISVFLGQLLLEKLENFYQLVYEVNCI